MLDQAELSNLGPGCYVQVGSQQHTFWVEIIRKDEDQFTGKIHQELGGNPPPTNKNYSCFKTCSITQLGCDNYCFC